MAETDIYNKLQRQLQGTRLFKQEMEVVYFMVELRKYMDHNEVGRRDEYAVIRFYCDWVLHTDKNQNLVDMKDIFDRLYASCKERVELTSLNPHAHIHVLDDFLRFVDLKSALFAFFREYYFDMFMLTDEKCWRSFVKQLLMVLQDQPIRNERMSGQETVKVIDSNIKEIKVLHADNREAQINVTFHEPISNKDGHNMYWVGLSSGHLS
jgi:hypothetical protein